MEGLTLIKLRGGEKDDKKGMKGQRTVRYVPPPGQKRGLDWRFASERPSNSAPQSPDFLFLAPVGAVKRD